MLYYMLITLIKSLNKIVTVIVLKIWQIALNFLNGALIWTSFDLFTFYEQYLQDTVILNNLAIQKPKYHSSLIQFYYNYKD